MSVKRNGGKITEEDGKITVETKFKVKRGNFRDKFNREDVFEVSKLSLEMLTYLRQHPYYRNLDEQNSK